MFFYSVGCVGCAVHVWITRFVLYELVATGIEVDNETARTARTDVRNLTIFHLAIAKMRLIDINTE